MFTPVFFISAKSDEDPTAEDEDDDESINIPSMSLSISREDLLMIGDDLELESYETPGILGSDQESTEGEAEPEIVDEEPFSNLDANLLLYKASAVHNLPVMAMAFALGANKLWRNKNDINRTFLHQAVLSVGNSIYDVNDTLLYNYLFFLHRALSWLVNSCY